MKIATGGKKTLCVPPNQQFTNIIPLHYICTYMHIMPFILKCSCINICTGALSNQKVQHYFQWISYVWSSIPQIFSALSPHTAQFFPVPAEPGDLNSNKPLWLLILKLFKSLVWIPFCLAYSGEMYKRNRDVGRGGLGRMWRQNLAFLVQPGDGTSSLVW